MTRLDPITIRSGDVEICLFAMGVNQVPVAGTATALLFIAGVP